MQPPAPYTVTRSPGGRTGWGEEAKVTLPLPQPGYN